MNFDVARLNVDEGIAEYLATIGEIFGVGLEIETIDNVRILRVPENGGRLSVKNRISTFLIKHGNQVAANLNIYLLPDGPADVSSDTISRIEKLVMSKLTDYYSINDLSRRMLASYNQITVYKKLGKELLLPDRAGDSYAFLLREMEFALSVNKCGILVESMENTNLVLAAYREGGKSVSLDTPFLPIDLLSKRFAFESRPVLLEEGELGRLCAIDGKNDLQIRGQMIAAPLFRRESETVQRPNGIVFAMEPINRDKKFKFTDINLAGMFASYASMALSHYRALNEVYVSQQEMDALLKELVESLSTTRKAKDEMDAMLKDLMMTFETLQQKSALIEHVNRISVHINKTLNLETIFASIADYAKNLLMSDLSMVAVMDEEGEMSFAAVAGIHKDTVSGAPHLAQRLSLENTFREKKRFIVGEGDPLLAPVGGALSIEARNYIVHPIENKGRVVAAIIVMNKQENEEYLDTDLELLHTLAGQAETAIENARLVESLKNTQFTMMAKLAALAEKRDPETGEHLLRMQRYCRVLAQHMSMTDKYAATIDEQFINEVFVASPLHDIGKVGINDDVLLKPGKLNEEEFEVMKTHAEIGAAILDGPDYLKMAADIARGHHEKWNGTGYPRGLAGDDIPLCARIVAVADVYDALTSKRVYKEGFSHEKAMGIIEGDTGKHFDPDVVEALKASVDKILKIKDWLQ